MTAQAYPRLIGRRCCTVCSAQVIDLLDDLKEVDPIANDASGASPISYVVENKGDLKEFARGRHRKYAISGYTLSEATPWLYNEQREVLYTENHTMNAKWTVPLLTALAAAVAGVWCLSNDNALNWGVTAGVSTFVLLGAYYVYAASHPGFLPHDKEGYVPNKNVFDSLTRAEAMVPIDLPFHKGSNIGSLIYEQGHHPKN